MDLNSDIGRAVIGFHFCNKSLFVKLHHINRMICPLKSEFGSQARAKGRTLQYVELLPVASKDPVVDGFETNTNAKEGVNVINFHTNNDGLFWKKP